LFTQVMTAEPYTSADRVFWITDNGSSHRGAASIVRMSEIWSNAHLVHLPVHASWMDSCKQPYCCVRCSRAFRAVEHRRKRPHASSVRCGTGWI
jgi:hypothetical protein